MITEEKKQYIPAVAAIILAVAICIKWQCEPTINYQPTTRDSIVQIISEKLKRDTILVDRWHKAIHATDSVVKLVYFSAPDTCKSYLDTMQVLLNSERAKVQKVVISKDSIIASYTALSKVDSATIQQRNDSIANHKCKRIKWFVIGFGAGYTTAKGVEIINKLK